MSLINLWPDDQVVELTAETSLADLQAALLVVGQTIPYRCVPGFAAPEDALGDLILNGYPHPAQGAFGGWSDWILGARMRMADGHVGSSGSRVVKSVAGYDVHRMLVGSRGELGRYESVILRTTPLALVPEWSACEPAGAIQRVLPSLRRDHPGVVAVDAEASLLWWRSAAEVVRTEDDQLWTPHGERSPTSDEAWFLARAKSALGESLGTIRT